MNVLCCDEPRHTRYLIKIILISISLCCWLSLAAPPCLQASTARDLITSDPDFPVYPSLKPNVAFWIDIFTKYSKAQGVIHDNRHLDIVYEIVALDPSQTLGANKSNQAIKAAAMQKYSLILTRLSKGAGPSSQEERRVAALFGARATPSNFHQAALNLRCQSGLKKEFKEGLIRSGAVLDEFKRIFRSHGLPVDLVYLPCVESSFDFKAYSRLGAAGVWQFTHSTGMEYMNIDYVVDERRDPYISADAAARLLKNNYAALGEWPMAITAYNHGLGGMMRAKKFSSSFEKIVQSYDGSSFKFASRNFYAEFLAAKIVAKNPDHYFENFVSQKPAVFQKVKTKGYLPIKPLAAALNLSIEEIQELNPSLRKPVFNEQKYIPREFDLKLPKTLAVTDTLLAKLYQSRQKPSRFHSVQKGDTASAIARLHSVSLNDLIHANNLNKRAGIFIGQNLQIPMKNETLVANNEPVTTRPRKISEKKIIAKENIVSKTAAKLPLPVLVGASTTPSDKGPEPSPVQSVLAAQPVKLLAEPPAESFAALSAEPFAAPPAKPLNEASSINPYIVTTNLKVFQTYQTGNLIIATIKVEAEETLGHYAGWLGIPTQDIRVLNKLKQRDAISVNQPIRLPMKKRTVQEFEELRYEFHKEIEEDFFESFSIQGVDTYEVKTGNTIWNLCSTELEIPFWLLKKYNPEIDFNSLQPKQKITYPIVNRSDAGKNG